MKAILHIEPITRQIEAPLYIGHNDFISYGELRSDDGENVGTPASYMPLGCPLETPDLGNTQSYIPLVKTIECTPDPIWNNRHLYSETLHYLDDRKILIPYRTKLHSGEGQGLRLSHLPSLNKVRQQITGVRNNVIDPRQEIIPDLLFKDLTFNHKRNLPLQDWLEEELTKFLYHYPVNELSFDKESIKAMIYSYCDQVKNTPSELTPSNLKNILGLIVPSSHIVPPHYFSPSAIEMPLSQFREHSVNSQVDFRSNGYLPVGKLPRIDYNPSDFKAVCEFIDKIPLTDFNIDLVVNESNEVEFYHEHIALNRFGLFSDQRDIRYIPNDLMDILDHAFVNDLLGKFVYFHREVTPEIQDIIRNEPIKIKLIKTISDEAVVLLYRYNSDANAEPLCGVYFDLAIQSLAPLSIISESIVN